ncbi:MAG: pentapeptide repeat-containing protein [Bacteroidota bacterium]
MKTLSSALIFPHSQEAGAPVQGINYHRIRQVAAASTAVSASQLEALIEAHHHFLRGGGAGGHWQTLLLNGLVTAVYQKEGVDLEEQFALEYRRLTPGLGLSERVLPFSNCCAASLPRLSAVGSTLSHSLFTDADLLEANFECALLQGVDFSRANLRSARFVDADLSGADFENCDLRGADFRGARLRGTRFPGALLDEVRI